MKKARLRDNLGYHPPANFDLRDSIWTSSIGTIKSLITSLPKISPKYNPDILLATIPRFVPIITCAWIVATESNHETMIPITAILESLLSTTSYPGESWKTEFADTIDESPLDVAGIGIRSVIGATVPVSDFDCRSMLGALLFLSHCTGCSVKFHRVFLAKKSVLRVSQALAHVCSSMIILRRRADFDEIALALQCMTNGIAYLAHCFHVEGSTWLFQALEQHLLVSVIKALPSSDAARSGSSEEDMLEFFCKLVFVLTTHHLVFKSVLGESLRSIKTIKSRGLDTRIEKVVQQSTVKDAWLDMCRVANDLEQTRSIYKVLDIGICALGSKVSRRNSPQ